MMQQPDTAPGAEFRATSVTKIQGSDNAQDAWRYLLKWERLGSGPDWVRAPPAVIVLRHSWVDTKAHRSL